jgi:alpha-tubulin suppressor-like RCC1 family protein
MRSVVLRSIRRALPAGLLALFAACTDQSSPIHPPMAESRDEIEIQTLSCTANVRTGTASCVEEMDKGAETTPSIILNPAGRWVRLLTSNSSYAGEVLTFDVVVQNLVPQTLGVARSGEYDGAGVRVFFAELPVVTSGTGSVSVNSAETGKLTRAGQLFYRYPQTLGRGETSAPRQWSFNVPATVNSFRYRVLVAASVQYPQGWVEIPHGSILRLDRGGTRRLKAVVRSAMGQDVTASAPPVSWSVADPSVATVAGSTLTGAAISGLSSVTATSGNLSATARIEVGAPFTRITAGGDHTCGLTSKGRAFCWGRNVLGELGDHTNTDRNTPTRVATDVEYAQIEAGYYHTCALNSAGRAWCWGYNVRGGLGDGTTTARNTPGAVKQGATTFTTISTGVLATCAVASTGQAWCWGHNSSGQLGDGTTQHRLLPAAVQQRGVPYDSITTNGEHTCGTASPRLAFCWGDNTYGQLGDTTQQPSLIPGLVTKGTERYVQISAGEAFTCARSRAGQAFCYGLNTSSQLGDNTTTSRRTPVAVHQGGTRYVQVTAGGAHACGLTAAGQTWCWGNNQHGQLGDNTRLARRTPVAVRQGTRTFVEIRAGIFHTCGRTAAGRVYCWGWNTSGQLGDGTNAAARVAPVPVQRAP